MDFSCKAIMPVRAGYTPIGDPAYFLYIIFQQLFRSLYHAINVFNLPV